MRRLVSTCLVLALTFCPAWSAPDYCYFGSSNAIVTCSSGQEYCLTYINPAGCSSTCSSSYTCCQTTGCNKYTYDIAVSLLGLLVIPALIGICIFVVCLIFWALLLVGKRNRRRLQTAGRPVGPWYSHIGGNRNQILPAPMIINPINNPVYNYSDETFDTKYLKWYSGAVSNSTGFNQNTTNGSGNSSHHLTNGSQIIAPMPMLHDQSGSQNNQGGSANEFNNINNNTAYDSRPPSYNEIDERDAKKKESKKHKKRNEFVKHSDSDTTDSD